VGQTILVVDDDPQLRMILTVFLEDAGYTVRLAADGQAALEAIAADRPDLVLSDVRMPRLDGLQLASHLRCLADPVPVILMSSGPAVQEGHAVRTIIKPFDVDHLLAVVHEVLAPST